MDRVSPLADEVNSTIGVQRDDANPVRDLEESVYSFLPVRFEHGILPHHNPGISVDDVAGQCLPW